MNVLSLDQLTVLGASPPQMVGIAADLGYQTLGLMMLGTPFIPIPPEHRLDENAALRREMKTRMAATGVTVNNIDLFMLTAQTDVSQFDAALETGVELGAKNAVAVVWDEDASRSLDCFCLLAEKARRLKLKLALEFTPLSSIASLSDAVAYLNRAAQPNAGMLVDVLHLTQSGGSASELTTIDVARIISAQICDGPRNPGFDEYRHNALFERQIPGTGQLPLREFIRALPVDTVLGVEVPLKSLSDAGISPRERARRCLTATRALLA
jgi:sugar phosphate isomerase/epimerase